MRFRSGPKNTPVTAGCMPSMTRREFCQLITALGVLGYIDDRTAALALETDETRLGWLANQEPGREGAWDLTDVEGSIPAAIDGTFYRTGPGQHVNHGVTLKHLFDGDAFVHAYTIRGGKVRVRGQYIATPQRLEEIELGRMIYSEYGTLAPKAPEGAPPPRHVRKNQPSVNIIPWDGRMLGLSEGGHPAEIDPQTLEFKSYWDYYGTLPPNVSHTAHPRYDPITGAGYCYGLEQGPTMALTVFRMEPNGRLTQLHKIPQQGYFMIHDMMLTRNYIVFAVPPIKYTLGELLSGRATPGMALKFYESEPLRFIIMSRDGSGTPVTIEAPANTVYHNGNSFEKDGMIHVDCCLSPDNSVNEMLNSWTKDKALPYVQTSATHLVLDPINKTIVSREVFGQGQDFPRFDVRHICKEIQYLYAMENGVPDDPVAFDQIVRHDFKNGRVDRAKAQPGQAFGESVFVPEPGSVAENKGWILNIMYDAKRDESCLEIRDAGSLEFVARVWTGTHFPLGFHGNFVSGQYIA
jgi:all-trans-8'-apo-beta-carotenal 15,15'-oxygenase